MSYQEKTICEQVREMEQNDEFGTTTISKYFKQNMREDINKTEAYYNGQLTSPKVDSEGREKPVKNICYGATNIWYRATARQPNSLYFKAENNGQQITALLATIKFHEWMEKVNFGQFLNEWGYALAKHGSSIPEFVEKDGELNWKVLDWNNILVDAIDCESNPIVKKIWYTPSQLKKNKSYNKEMVDSLIDNLKPREIINGQTVDTKSNYILVYEVHGEFSVAQLKKGKGEEVLEGDEDEYTQQMHAVSFQAKKENPNEFDEHTLFAGKEKRSPHLLTHLIKKEGQTYVGGAPYNLFETQWMINDTEKMKRDRMLITSKVFFQGSDPDMDGANLTTNLDNGEYLKHEVNQPMTQVQTDTSTASLDNQINSWLQFGNSINGIADAMVQSPTAGTAWRSLQSQLQEAHSLFEKFGQTKDLYLKEIVNTYILPFFKKTLIGDSKPISKILEAHEIKQIDSKYLSNEVNKRMNQKIKDTILSGETYDTAQQPQDQAQITQQVQGELTGNQRFVHPVEVDWATELEDLDWNLELITESDSKEIQDQLATYQTALTFLANLQGRPMTDEEQMIFNSLVSLTGTISPLQLNQGAKPPQQMQPQQPQLNQQPTQTPAMVGK